MQHDHILKKKVDFLPRPRPQTHPGVQTQALKQKKTVRYVSYLLFLCQHAKIWFKLLTNDLVIVKCIRLTN